MAYTETRPYPVSGTVVMRSTLFALASMGATLQTYNEETGVIVATVSRWMGLQKKEVMARIRGFEQTSQLDIEAPDIDKAQELFSLVNTYVRDGGRIQANASMQWVDLARQQEQRVRRQELGNKARAMLRGDEMPGPADSNPSEPTSLELLPADDPARQVAPSSSKPIYIPDNPGVLIKNRQNMIVELKVDPAVFTDRTAYLVSCTVCQTTALRGSSFCPNCGRPLTLEAIQPEMRKVAESTASGSFSWGLAGLAFNAVPLLILIVPALVEAGGTPWLEAVGQNLTTMTIALSTAAGLIPAVFCGLMALRKGQRASWYQNLPAVVAKDGRLRATVGSALGWLSIYLAAAWVILIIIALR